MTVQSRSVGPGSCALARASYKAAIWFRRSIAALSVIAAAKRRARSASSRKRSASVVADVFGFEAIIDPRREGQRILYPISLSPREDASSIKFVLHFIGDGSARLYCLRFARKNCVPPRESIGYRRSW